MSQNVAVTTPEVYVHHSITESPTKDYALHYHNSFEVYYFISGDIRYLVEGKRYIPESDSLLIISPKVFHGVKIESDLPYERYALHFSAEVIPSDLRFLLLSPFHQSNSELYYKNASQFHIREYLDQILQCEKMPQDLMETALSIAVQRFLAQLVFMSREVNGAAPQEGTNDSVVQILQYINENIASPIALDDLSAKFFISKHHLNKVFKHSTGTTVGEYIIHKRVFMAKDLIAKGTPASQAAFAVGFGDYSNFYRAYTRVLKHSPSEDKGKA